MESRINQKSDVTKSRRLDPFVWCLITHQPLAADGVKININWIKKVKICVM